MLVSLINKLRFGNPWKYKAPLLICWPYMMIGFMQTPPLRALFFISLAYATLFGIAALGYFINDWSDIESDRKAGKPNKLGELKLATRLLILLLLGVFAFIPWFWLPSNTYSYLLLGVEILLFMMYSLPPFRLKERGFVGILCDSFYAYLIPSALSSLTFFLVGNVAYTNLLYFLSVLLVWLIFVGIRGILLHQLQDYKNDLDAGVHTFVTKAGIVKSEKLVKNLLPLELVFFTGFFVFVFNDFYLLFPVFMLFCLVRYIKHRKEIFGDTGFDYRKFSYRFLDDFYLDVLPVILLTHLVLVDWRYLCLLVLHLMFFRSFVKAAAKRLKFI